MAGSAKALYPCEVVSGRTKPEKCAVFALAEPGDVAEAVSFRVIEDIIEPGIRVE